MNTSDSSKSNKIVKRVLIGVAIVVAVVAVGGMVLSRVASKKLHTALADIPGARIDFKGMSFSPILGNLEFRDVEIAIQDSTNAGPQIEGRIEAIKLERLSWKSLTHGEASAKRLVIREPEVQMILTGKKAAEKKDTAGTSPEASFLKKVSLSELRVEKGKIDLDSQKGSLKVSAKGLNCSVRDIGLLLAENQFEYNDSCYAFAVDSLDYIDVTGLSRIQMAHLATADAGPVKAQAMHLYNTVSQEQVAEKMGKVAAMWYDVKIDSMATSPLNIPRMVQNERVEIDSIYLAGPDITLFQDDRYPPAVPYATLQEGLNTLDMPLLIKRIDARVKAFTFIWETTHINRGTFPLHNLRLSISSVSNAPNNLMKMGLKSGSDKDGRLDFSLHIRNNKQESTQGFMKISGLDASRLDDFVRPLFGATAKADIRQIDCTFKGDKHQMTEDFCMLYDNLKLHAWNDISAPYKIVSKNSGFVSFLANLAVASSNPSKPGKEPKKVEVTFERDPMTPYPAYIIQNLTMGMLRTVLPGGAVHKNNKK